MPAAAWWGAQVASGVHSDVPQPSGNREQLNTKESRDLVQQLSVPPKEWLFQTESVLSATCFSSFFFPKGFLV